MRNGMMECGSGGVLAKAGSPTTTPTRSHSMVQHPLLQHSITPLRVALACSDWRPPASRPCGIPPCKKARVPAYSRIFQPLPLGGGGCQMAIFIQPCPLARQRSHLSRLAESRDAMRYPPPLPNRKSKIPPCPHHSTTPTLQSVPSPRVGAS